MKIYWVSLFAGFVTLVSFQNCQKSPFQDEINIARNLTAVDQSNKVNLSEQRVDQVDLFTEAPEAVTKNGKTFSVITSKTLQIDLGSGRITVVSAATPDVQVYCLTNELKNELLNIVKTSSVCKKSDTTPPDTVCAAVVVPAYARIVTSADQFDLGAAGNSCKTSIKVDLCSDDQVNLLKGFTAHLKNQISTLACSN